MMNILIEFELSLCICICMCELFIFLLLFIVSLIFWYVHRQAITRSVYITCCMLFLFLQQKKTPSRERVCRCTLISQIMPHYTSRSTFELIHMRTNINRKTAYTLVQRITMQQTYARANGQMNE